MGCSSCGTKVIASNASNMVSKSYRVQQPVGPCEFTDDILNVWLDKVKWFKDKGLYIKYKVAPATINKYLGILITSININNKCTYKDMLNGEISSLVTFITGIQNV